jgi:hypothetical protein
MMRMIDIEFAFLLGDDDDPAPLKLLIQTPSLATTSAKRISSCFLDLDFKIVCLIARRRRTNFEIEPIAERVQYRNWRILPKAR